MMTARVLLPYVASINLLLSLASEIIRLIGADSGDTMEMMRFADTTLPNPILINVRFNLAPPLPARHNHILFYFRITKNDADIQCFKRKIIQCFALAL